MERELSIALHDAADILRLQWFELGIQAGLSPNGDYLNNLVVGNYFEDYDGASIVVGDYSKHAYWVEVGHGMFNLAEKIDPSKWRIGKKGNRYIRIPFTHLTGGDSGMPKEVYNVAKKLSAQKPRMDASVMRKAGIEDFGIRSKIFPGFGTGRRTWTHSPYENMFKTTMTTKSPSGMITTSSKYRTIRTITPESEWIIPPMPGKFLRERALKESEPLIREAFSQSMLNQMTIFVNSEIRAVFSNQ